MRIAFYGSSLLSSLWNGAATYYRGMLGALSGHGWDIVFHEPDAFGRQAHRDIEPPDWATSRIWPASEAGARAAAGEAAGADVVVKASGVGVFDDLLLDAVLDAADPGAVRLFWDVDAPATLAGLAAGSEPRLAARLPDLDAVLTYGGGEKVVSAYLAAGARACLPVYNALDPRTHHPAPPDPRFAADLAFLGNRLPDREARVETFLFGPARRMTGRRFLLGGSGWEAGRLPDTVTLAGHVGTADHNAFNSTPLAVLNVARDSMADAGFSPATRVFEAAGAGACLITDAWEGISDFLEPDREVLVARDGADVERLLADLTSERAAGIGAAARQRVLAEHTYDRRAVEVDALLRRLLAETAAEQPLARSAPRSAGVREPPIDAGR